RLQRQTHPALQQPPPPHRNRPTPRPNTRPGARARPTRPHPDHQRATATRLRTRPQPRLPTTTENTPTKLRVFTMSRDICARCPETWDCASNGVFGLTRRPVRLAGRCGDDRDTARYGSEEEGTGRAVG